MASLKSRPGLFFRRLKAFTSTLVEPVPSVQGTPRHHARFLAALLVFMLPLGYLISLFPLLLEHKKDRGTFLNIGVTFLWVVAYWLTRTGRYRVAMWLVITVASVVMFAAIVASGSEWGLVYLLILVLVANAVLAAWEVALLGCAYVLISVLLPVFATGFSAADVIIGPLRFDIIGVVVILLVYYHQHTLAQDRQAALYESEARYRDLFERVPVGLFRSTVEGWLLECNSAALQLVAYPDIEILRRVNIAELYVSPEDREALIHRLRTEDVITGYVTQIYRYDRLAIWIEMDLRAVRDETGVLRYLDGAFQDITLRRQAEDQQRELALERERVTMLERLLSDMSYDLKTPLTKIKAGLELLQAAPDPARAEERFTLVGNQVEHLERVFENMLILLGLVQSDRFDFQPISLNSVVQGVQTALAASTRQVRLEFFPGPDLPHFPGDRKKLTKALTEIVRNALIHVPDGGLVILRTYRHETYGVVDVVDNGAGIPDDVLPHIFDTFFRGDPGRRTRSGGAGLGLPIAKRIIERHGGRVQVETTLGQGSTFRIFIPLSGPPGISDRGE